MRIACWITNATYTHSEYVILIAFPRQEWLRERAPVLRLYVYRLSWFIPSVWEAMFYYDTEQEAELQLPCL